MIENPIDIKTLFPVRKNRKQKTAFLKAVEDYVLRLGYTCIIEKGSMGARNIIIGDPVKAKHLITAHYDTCAGMIIPNIITPCNIFLFVLYQIALTVCILFPAVLLWRITDIFINDPVISLFTFPVFVMLCVILMLYGPANKSNANDNTSGVVAVLEIAKTMLPLQRDDVCFILFDLEETGLIGSSSYRKKNKKSSDSQIVWNLDCVGDGDEMILFPSKKIKKDQKIMAMLEKCNATMGNKCISVHRRGFSIYPSDQANFPYGIGIAALHRCKFGLYISKIHTRCDTFLDESNINILRAAIISAITCDGVH